ncbi:hypothetical protein ACOSQ2_004355 [Xanthoceras sorbifolium]
MGFGVVIRDEKGLVLAASAHNYNSLVTVEVAEAMAILHGIRFAAERGTGPIGVENDSLSLVFVINSKDIPHSDVGLVLSDIIHFFYSLPAISVGFVPRKCNAVAHGLAKFSLCVVEPLHWLEDSPPYVEALVMAEVSNQL